MTKRWTLILIGILVCIVSIFFIIIAGLIGLIFGVLAEFFGGGLPTWLFVLYLIPGIFGLPAGIFLIRGKRWRYSLIFGSLVFFFPPIHLVAIVLTSKDGFSDLLLSPLLPFVVSLILGIVFLSLMTKSKHQFN